MTDRRRILMAMAAGLAWSLAVLALGVTIITIPVFALIPTIMTAFLGPGLVMAAMVGRVAQRRFFETGTLDPLSERGEVDRRVLQNTVEQLVLAAAIWPAVAVLLGPTGPGVIVALGVGFSLARIVFWVGCHRAGAGRGEGLRALGFAATFYPTVLAALWTIVAFVV